MDTNDKSACNESSPRQSGCALAHAAAIVTAMTFVTLQTLLLPATGVIGALVAYACGLAPWTTYLLRHNRAMLVSLEDDEPLPELVHKVRGWLFITLVACVHVLGAVGHHYAELFVAEYSGLELPLVQLF